MKISKVTLTQKEREDIEKYLDIDPCGYFDCGGMNCDRCPFNKITSKMNEARDDFMQILKEVAMVKND